MDPGHPVSIPVSFGPDPVELPPGLPGPNTPPPLPSANTSVTSQQPAYWHPGTPKAQNAFSNVIGQQAAGPSVGHVFGRELSSVLETIPRDDKGFAFMSAMVRALGETLDHTGTVADTQQQNNILRIFNERLQNEMHHLSQAAAYPPASSSQACVPIAAPCIPPKLQGAAAGAPPPSSFLPAGLPPFPNQEVTSPVRGRPISQVSNQGTRGESGSSESSSPSRSPPPNVPPPNNPGDPADSSWGLPLSGATCRVVVDSMTKSTVLIYPCTNSQPLLLLLMPALVPGMMLKRKMTPLG